MSDTNVCRSEERSQARPCFIGPDDKPDCRRYKVEECGIVLDGIPLTPETKSLFDIAARTGLNNVLSSKDAESHFSFLEPRGDSEIKVVVDPNKAQRFMTDARALVERIRRQQAHDVQE